MPQTADHQLVRAFLAHKRTWADAHRRNAVSSLNRWTTWLADRPDGRVDLIDATPADCNEYLRWREGQVASAHKDYQYLGWLYEWLAAEQELPQVRKGGRWVDPPAKGPMTGVDAPRVAEPLPERIGRVDEIDYRRLMASFDRRVLVDCRDAAMLSLMWRTGPRRHEVAGAQLDRLVIDAEGGSLDILGKNRKWRTIWLAEETIGWLERYLRRRHDDGDALFASTRRRSHGGGLSPDGITEMLNRRADRAGVAHLTAHQFRRAAACDMRARGIPDVDIIRILGWDPLTGMRMLTRYTRPDSDALAAANFRRLDPTARRRPRVRPLRAVGI